ncbi:MAG: AAA family ATPase [Candidatus Omnitrophota bacterium]
MYFKKLELVSFKSFCDKTTLNFEPGITAVVGPNGCGKSNIFDSIRWVLGEQSAKSLRGSEMEDVIFNGTDTKEPLGMAEVTLTFDNKERFFNLDHDEVAITRQLFRSGESEYQLNRTTVRLKDILDLLMGTGIGAESYSMVAQGKIDLVLSSRPEDRRLVFDEASGITKYKSQKRETSRRLEETEQNLLRVNDIITEVKRQIGSLERQANKARRYKEVFEELKFKEINLSLLRKIVLLNQQEEITKGLKEYSDIEAELLNRIREEEAKVSNRQSELKLLEDKIMDIRNRMLEAENSISGNNQHIKIYKERIAELELTKGHLAQQIGQVKNRLIMDQEKLDKMKEEYGQIASNIEKKTQTLKEKESRINSLAHSIKGSLESISLDKKSLLELAARIANAKNEISDFSAKQQIFLARKKRLEIEKAKTFEEKTSVNASLDRAKIEVESLKKSSEALTAEIFGCKAELESETACLSNIDSKIQDFEKQIFTLQSHKDFLEKLKTEYDDIGESMNAVVYLDKLPSEKVSGLVLKIKDYFNLNEKDQSYFKSNFKLSAEAKPIELDTHKIEEKLDDLENKISTLRDEKKAKQSQIAGLHHSLSVNQAELRTQEISLANKESILNSISEQHLKIMEEEQVISMELQDVFRELIVLENNLLHCQSQLAQIMKTRQEAEDKILEEEESISKNSKEREKVLMDTTQVKTELEGLNHRLVSDEATLKILEDTYSQDLSSISNIENQIKDAKEKKGSLESGIEECLRSIEESSREIEAQKESLEETQESHKQLNLGSSDTFKAIAADKKELEALKNNLHELQMSQKDIEYKYASIKERMLQAYKVDLDTQEPREGKFEEELLSDEIAKLKHKLDSYGSVNLIAIEEYDELKKRYDFLIQQQNDLLQAKESLRQAILKINRTTKQMFLETFEKVKIEFKNYFKLLFNGGDAQVFLIDEQDPLESGIEIICRPPGKKLQNVLLLSGGEKSMSAIALIFAIFKVKPSPFCILDEIDAALDEANVIRFSRLLQEFAKISQFIVITHNKKTITNANVMYGITMQQSGVSKIVSVKFATEGKKEAESVEVALS